MYILDTHTLYTDKRAYAHMYTYTNTCAFTCAGVLGVDRHFQCSQARPVLMPKGHSEAEYTVCWIKIKSTLYTVVMINYSGHLSGLK